MIKKHSLGYGGMNQDTAKSKTDNSTYFTASNIKLLATTEQSTFGLTNASGNELAFDIPIPSIDKIKTRISYGSQDTDGTTSKSLNYQRVDGTCQLEEVYLPNGGNQASSGTQYIVGTVDTRTGSVIVSTDNNGWDCFWELNGVDEGDIKLDLLYINDLKLNTASPVKAVYNYENSLIEKIYFADGNRQLGHFNMRMSIENDDLKNLIDTRSETINAVSEYTFSSPKIGSVVGGGNITAGTIQYAYNLYILNGSQTTISPVSPMVSINKGDGLGGGKVNEELGRAVNVIIDNIDQSFTHIKIYSIKYTSYNEVPEINLVAEREISGPTLNYYDDGISKDTLTLEQFLLLGSAPYIPRHIESKDSRLFMLNVKEKYFSVDIDARCYGHANDGSCMIWENLTLPESDSDPALRNLRGSEFEVNTTTYAVPKKHDSINRSYEGYSFTADGVTFGVEGKYFKLKIVKKSNLPEDYGLLKDSEIYRFGLEFYNKLGQKSEPIWVADVRAPKGNLSGELNTVSFEAKPEFYTWLETTEFEEDQQPVGYRLLRADRTENDKTISTQGLINPMISNYKTTNLTVAKEPFGQEYYAENTASKMPSLVRLVGGLPRSFANPKDIPVKACEDGLNLQDGYSPFDNKPTEVLPAKDGDQRAGNWQFNKMMQITSPETLFSAVSLDSSYKIRVVGHAGTKQLINWAQEIDEIRQDKITEVVFENNFVNFGLGIQGPTIATVSAGGAGGIGDRGLLGPTNTDHGNNVMQMYRDFTGDFTYAAATANGNSALWSVTVSGVKTVENRPVTITLDGVDYTSMPFPRNSSASYVAGGLAVAWSNIPGYNVQLIGLTIWIGSNTPGFRTIALSNISGLTFTIQEEVNGNNDEIDNSLSEFNIYGQPEFTGRGANFKSYNGDGQFRYANTLKNMQMNAFSDSQANEDSARTIYGINSFAANCITVVEGSDDKSTPLSERKSIEEMHSSAFGGGAGIDDGVMIVELVRNQTYAYLGNIYGGNTYEDKSTSDYLAIGDYTIFDSDNPVIQIDSPGDTFCSDFKFTRLSKIDDENSAEKYVELTEIVNIRVESTIDLTNRSDTSGGAWDNAWQPEYEDFQDYNRVYSQQSTLVTTSDLGFKFKTVKEFDTKIISSKPKISAEYVDSWTDFLENETLELDGKYGSINATVNFNDEIYTWQDNAFAKINVNPRVQIQGNDGVGLELGTGQVLNDYRYISTDSGALNDSSIVKSNNSIYFFDLNNMSIYKYSQNGVTNLTDAGGMHTYMQNNIDYNSILNANPFKKNGISGGYDQVNNDVYFTFLQDDFVDPNTIPFSGERKGVDQTANNFTLSYNEAIGKFVSFHNFTPSLYLTGGVNMMTTGPSNSSLWVHKNTSEKGLYYGNVYPSIVDFNINPMGTENKVFTNLSYKMEARDINGFDLPNRTFYSVILRNEYQTSLPTLITPRKNAKRRDRTWNLTLPREAFTRNRIKSPWARMRLAITNEDNAKIVAHDLIVSYTEY